MLKPPLYALLIAPDRKMRSDIIQKVKKITIREGHRDYKAGHPVMLCCPIEPWAVMADIVSVRHTWLAEVSEDEWRDDGFKSREDLLIGLKKYYPDLNLNSPITVIRWENVRGALTSAEPVK